MSNDAKDILLLRKAIEKRMGWGPAAKWHSKMFAELSEEIFKETQVVLSVATLKRFFGVVKHDGSASVSTLDALSQFLGSGNWTAFKTQKKRKSFQIKAPGKPMYVTLGFILAMFIFGLLSNRTPEVVINASDFAFSSKVLSHEFPNSVVFDFLIPKEIHADSFQIQQYWDPTKTIDVEQDQTQATGIYYYPGYFEAKLMVNGQPARTHDLFLKSNGWHAQIEYASAPKYFEPLVEGRHLRAPEAILQEVRAQENPVVTSFHFVEDLGDLSGDNFRLRATIKNTFDERWAVCHGVRIFCLASTGAFVIPFSKVGCSSDNNLMLNDLYLNGKSNDLSSLSADFTQETTLEVQVVNQEVTLIIDETEVYTGSYQNSMGKLVGMRFKFLGLGEVLDYELLDLQGNDALEGIEQL